MISANDFARDARALPMLKGQELQLIRLLDDPDADLSSIGRLVKADPAMTANLLRLANSVIARGAQPVATAHEAIVRLGLRQVGKIVLGKALHAVLPPDLAGYALSSEGFFRHCVAVAIFTEQLGKRLGGRTESWFTAGLLHDMGKLVVSTHLARSAPEVAHALEAVGATFVQAERTVLGTDHTEVAGLVARHWGLPDELAIAARWHHAPLEAPAPQRTLACAVHVADALAHLLGMGADQGELRRELDSGACEVLRLTSTALEDLCRESLVAIEAFAATPEP